MTAKDKDAEAIQTQALENENGTPRSGPEARGQQSVATLEEAMALQDKLARERNGTTEPSEE